MMYEILYRSTKLAPGDEWIITTDKGMHRFRKTIADPEASPLEGWVRCDAENALGEGAVRLMILEPSSAGGAPFRTEVREPVKGYEVAVTDLGKDPGDLRTSSIGLVTSLSHVFAEDVKRP